MKLFPFTMSEHLLSNLSKPLVWQSSNLTRNPISSLCCTHTSLEWTKQLLLLHKLPADYTGCWVQTFLTSHSPAKDCSLVERKPKSNTPPCNETQWFQCAHPQWGQSKLVWVQDWCWPYTQCVGKLGNLLLFKDLGQVSWMLLLGDNVASLN